MASPNLNPIFVKEGNFFPARITGTNSVIDGSDLTNMQAVVTATTDGTRVDGVRFFYSGNAGTSTISPSTGVYRIYLTNTNGTQSGLYTPRLIGEITRGTGARSISVTPAGSSVIYTFDQPIIMQSGQKMLVSMSAATTYISANDQTDAIAFANNY